MPKKPGTNPKGEFVFFDVVYEDGSQRSNRRVPAELLGRAGEGRARAWFHHRAGSRDCRKIRPRAAGNQDHCSHGREEEVAGRAKETATPTLLIGALEPHI